MRGRPVSLKARAVGLLARRECARAELMQRLLAGGASRDEAAAVLDELAAQGLLSNERYAHAVVAQKSGAYSRQRIRGDLKRKGVGAEAIDAALAEAAIDDDAALRALWQRRFGVPPASERDKARQVRFLQSRGFDLAAILKLLRALAA